MTIILTQAIREAGSVVASGTTITRAADVEADLVARGFATFVGSGGGIFAPGNSLIDEARKAYPADTFQRNINGVPIVAPLKTLCSYEHNAGMLNYTISMTYLVPRPFYGFRVRFFNLNSSPIINAVVGAAVSRNMTGGIHVATETPVQITVGGASTFTKPAAISGGGTSSAIWSEVISDWIMLPSVPRDDGGSGHLLEVRVQDPTAGNTSSNRCGGMGSTASDVNTYGVGSVVSGNDKTFTNWGTFAIVLSGLGGSIALDFLCAEQCLTVATFGDSTIAGQNNTVFNGSGALLAAMDSLSSSRPVFLWNQGESSMTSNVVLSLAEKTLASGGINPQMAAMCPYSSNDTDKYTQAGVSRCLATALIFLDLCRKARCVPILVTPVPYSGLTEAQEGFRRDVCSGIRQIAAKNGSQVVDRDLLFTNYATSCGGWVPGLVGDGTHPGAVGYAAEKALWQSAFESF